MSRVRAVSVSVMVAFTLWTVSAYALETHLLKARVADVEGRPMEGAKLFLYDSSNVRRPADFISPLSDRSGLVSITLPPGKYWVIARFKSDGKYGPLLPGDKHSGEPQEIDLAGSDAGADFVVADIREIGQKKRAAATDALRLKGRIVDPHGVPAAHAYVFANRSSEPGELPDFISAWTDDDGLYELYLPHDAAYFVGAAREFPLKKLTGILKPLVFDRGKIDIAIDIDFTVE